MGSHRRAPARLGGTDLRRRGRAGGVTAMSWIRDRALTLALMAMFLLFLAGQLLTGFAEYNSEQTQHGHTAVTLTDYLTTGHLWEAIFENWESKFLQMAVFVLLTTLLIQKGSPESRPPDVMELVDTDPRDFADDPDARRRREDGTVTASSNAQGRAGAGAFRMTSRRGRLGARPPVISGACETLPSSAIVSPAECDVRTSVAIHLSADTPNDDPAQSRVSPTDEAMSAPKRNGTAETSFDRPTGARSRRRCRIGVRRDASRWACRDGTH